MHTWLISYDICDCSKRAAVARRLEKAGRRIQKSVFVVQLREHAMQKLERELHSLLVGGDSLLILPICAHCLAKAEIYADLPETFMIV